MPALAYVSNGNKVSVIDTSTNTIVNAITVEPANNITKLIAITPDGRFAYITNLFDFVAVIDTCTNSVIDTITVGDFPSGVAVTPNGRYVYVANSGLTASSSGTISVIDTSTNTVIQTIPVGPDPTGIAITPDGSFAYVTIAKADSVSVLSTATNTVVKNIPVGDFPQGIAITPDGKFAYVANQGQNALTNTVSVIDISTNTVVDTITVGVGPAWIAITPDSSFAYVTNVFDGTVSVIDTGINEVVHTIPVGGGPIDIAVTPDGSFAYVTNFISNSVSVIDTTTNSVVDTISNLSGPLGIAIANIPPCSTPSGRVCIETARIFDSCMFEKQLKETFEFPCLDQDIECKVIRTKCSILDITKIDESRDLVNVKLRIKVIIGFIRKCFDNPVFERTVYFDKNVMLNAPEGTDISCDIDNAACECIHTSEISCNHMICCTVKVSGVVKSKRLVQIEIPFLESCQPKQCHSFEGIPVAPGETLTLPNEPTEVSRIKFAAKIKSGMNSQITAFLSVIPYTSLTVIKELKPFEIIFPGGPYPVQNISLKNLGKSTIYIYKLTTE